MTEERHWARENRCGLGRCYICDAGRTCVDCGSEDDLWVERLTRFTGVTRCLSCHRARPD